MEGIGMGRDTEKRFPGAVDPRDGEYLGSEGDADVYRSRVTGEVFHIGQGLTTRDPTRYEGEPSLAGKVVGEAIKAGIGLLRKGKWLP